jgi:hypothetical protein
MQLVKQLLWPPACPPALGVRAPNDRLWWGLTCGLLILPLTAVAHHVIFYPSTCMLNPFGATDYSSPGALSSWLSRDPSLPWSITMALVIFLAGKRFPTVKTLSACLLISFLPLALWIWDIPFTGRFIHEHAHDDKLHLLGWPIRTRYFYILGIFLFASFLNVVRRKSALKTD